MYWYSVLCNFIKCSNSFTDAISLIIQPVISILLTRELLVHSNSIVTFAPTYELSHSSVIDYTVLLNHSSAASLILETNKMCNPNLLFRGTLQCAGCTRRPGLPNGTRSTERTSWTHRTSSCRHGVHSESSRSEPKCYADLSKECTHAYQFVAICIKQYISIFKKT